MRLELLILAGVPFLFRNANRIGSTKPKIFYGWWIVLAAAAINVYGAGVWFYGFPIFFRELLVEFPTWGRGATAGAVAFSRLEGGLEAPIVGWLVDKFGPKKLAVMGAVIAGLGFIAMSWVADISIGGVHISALIVFYVVYGVIISVGYNTGFSHAAMAAVANWFIRYRSRAFALWSLGAGTSGLTVILLGLVVASFGWRTASLLVGVGMFIFVIPLCLVLRHTPEEYGYLPDGDPPRQEAVESATQTSTVLADAALQEQNFTPKQALLTQGFWMLVLASAARSITMTSVVVHQIAYFTEDVGIPLIQASSALGAMVFVSLIGRFSMGWMGDRIEKRYLLIASYLLQVSGIFLLARVSDMTDIWMFVVVYGIGYGGAIPVYMAIVGDYFGRRSYATIRGLQQFFLIPATVVGPIYAGLVFDFTNSYQFAFNSFIIALLVGVIFLFLARRPDALQTSQ